MKFFKEQIEWIEKQQKTFDCITITDLLAKIEEEQDDSLSAIKGVIRKWKSSIKENPKLRCVKELRDVYCDKLITAKNYVDKYWDIV